MTYCRIRIGIAGGDGGQLLELGVDVTMTSPQPLTVDDAQRAELAELDRHRRRHQRIGRVTQDRGGLEPVGIDLPRGGDVLGGTGPTGRDDADVVQFVGPSGRPAHADFDEVTHQCAFLGGSSAAHRPYGVPGPNGPGTHVGCQRE